MRWRRCAPEFPNPLTPAPVPLSARRCLLTFAAVQVAAMVEQHGLSAQQQADRKQQVLSELRARIGDMDDEEFSEFLEAFGDAIIDSTCPAPPPPTLSDVLPRIDFLVGRAFAGRERSIGWRLGSSLFYQTRGPLTLRRTEALRRSDCGQTLRRQGLTQ